MYFRPSDCWPQCPQCYNLELTTFQSRWHFDILTRSVTDSFCLRIQENWGINLCEWIFECLLSIMTPVHQDMSTSLARTGAVMFSKNFLALIAGLVHVINYDSEFKLIQLPEPHLCTHNAAQCPLWHIPNIARVRQHLVQDKYVTWPPCSLSKMSRVPQFIQATNLNGQPGIQKQSDNFNSNNLETQSISVSKLCTFATQIWKLGFSRN